MTLGAAAPPDFDKCFDHTAYLHQHIREVLDSKPFFSKTGGAAVSRQAPDAPVVLSSVHAAQTEESTPGASGANDACYNPGVDSEFWPDFWPEVYQKFLHGDCKGDPQDCPTSVSMSCRGLPGWMFFAPRIAGNRDRYQCGRKLDFATDPHFSGLRQFLISTYPRDSRYGVVDVML